MTMHLVRGLSSTKTSKRKKTKTNKRLAEATARHEAWLKSMGVDDASLEKKLPKNKQGKRVGINDIPDYREHQGYAIALSDTIAQNGIAKEKQIYTGTLIKGIATMHKSNAVPIIDKKQAIEISTMRRN